MERLSYGERKALTALQSYGRIIWRRMEGAVHSEEGAPRMGGFSVEDMESLVNQGFAKRTQVSPNLVFRVTGPGMGAEL
ncbi:hypothetical protein SAMN02745216_02595 [Desulfatibacillum alkenivorans DSM 16219]|jgi:hypothetical protein|uniref:Uncharacterized protein n=1 Tax=Desulfatibacillum alkenivorans DSM 16219 TaxID=1121393 RepID=A0A1M6NIA9_9BACT|nr:hypothetical protein [Desulfatibacillum alkenivorans]SHJ95427.1 hypothetical protein SAMN02745216_02595 [Desulfatibacillum alkenivorans DSM 16219]